MPSNLKPLKPRGNGLALLTAWGKEPPCKEQNPSGESKCFQFHSLPKTVKGRAIATVHPAQLPMI